MIISSVRPLRVNFSKLGIRLHTMSQRRSRSPSAFPRATKRQKSDFEPLTPEDYKNGIVLAPMVRSGALPTRLYALKHGASLVWGPETVDKAILHTTREVDPVTGVVSYVGKSKAIFTTHPIEKPYLIYQIGSADPEVAVQAAKAVMQDVAGFDLNCGCPKPFSTHAGMGAALLSNPDLLCSILTALRQAMPPEISVSAKIRLLPSREDTLKLVERIVNTGVSALTVHCRTRNQRKREPALIERLREIVDFVEGMGRDVAVIENGDCEGFEDGLRIRRITGAHSVMIATAAESNPTCFSPAPLVDLEQTFIPQYIRLCKYLNNHWSSTKFCTSQFKGPHVNTSRADTKAFHEAIMHAKGYDDIAPRVEPWAGEEEFRAIVDAIESRHGRIAPLKLTEQEGESAIASKFSRDSLTPEAQQIGETAVAEKQDELVTPPTGEPETAAMNTPLGPANGARLPMPAMLTGDLPTPTPALVSGATIVPLA